MSRAETDHGEGSPFQQPLARTDVLLVGGANKFPIGLWPLLVRGGGRFTSCSNVRSALGAATARRPSCVVVSADVPGGGAALLARCFRGRKGLLTCPIIALVDDPVVSGEPSLAVPLFSAGVDVVMRMPTADALSLQIQSCVRIASRLRSPGAGEVPSWSKVRAIECDTSVISVAGLLTALDLEERTGVVEMFERGSGKLLATLDVVRGYCAGASLGGAPELGLRAATFFLRSDGHRIAFTPLGVSRVVPKDEWSTRKVLRLRELLVEAVRRTDEASLEDAPSAA